MKDSWWRQRCNGAAAGLFIKASLTSRNVTHDDNLSKETSDFFLRIELVSFENRHAQQIE